MFKTANSLRIALQQSVEQQCTTQARNYNVNLPESLILLNHFVIELYA